MSWCSSRAGSQECALSYFKGVAGHVRSLLSVKSLFCFPKGLLLRLKPHVSFVLQQLTAVDGLEHPSSGFSGNQWHLDKSK